MATQPLSEIMPIWLDVDGRYRVGETQILLDLLIDAYHQGSTPETIIDYYPSLSLEEVYLAIGYYLRHRELIDIYRNEQHQLAIEAQSIDEQRYPKVLTREMLIERLQTSRNNDEK